MQLETLLRSTGDSARKKIGLSVWGAQVLPESEAVHGGRYFAAIGLIRISAST